MSLVFAVLAVTSIVCFVYTPIQAQQKRLELERLEILACLAQCETELREALTFRGNYVGHSLHRRR